MPDTPRTPTNADEQPKRVRPPAWIPHWLGETERAALILALGMVVAFAVAAAIVSFGIYIALHAGPIDIR